MNTYQITFQDNTTTTFNTKRNLAVVVAYVRADGRHGISSMHASRNAATKFINSAQAARLLDHETVHGLRENMSDELRAKVIRRHEEAATKPSRPMKFYVAEAQKI